MHGKGITNVYVFWVCHYDGKKCYFTWR